MSNGILARIATSKAGNIGAAFAVTYLVAGVPILHWWARKYFKGPNFVVYHSVFVVAFLALWILLSTIGANGNGWKRIVFGAGIGLIAGILATGTADYTLMEPGMALLEWLRLRVTLANVLILNIALLPWLFGAVFATVSCFLERRLRRSNGAPIP